MSTTSFTTPASNTTTTTTTPRLIESLKDLLGCQDHHDHQFIQSPITLSSGLTLCSFQQEPKPIDQPHPNITLQKIISHLSSSSPPNAITHAILNELDCSLCSQTFDIPITTTCGHTFCQSCLHRSQDYSDRCPVCRQTVMLRFHQHQLLPSPDRLITRIIHLYFPTSNSTTPSTTTTETITTHNSNRVPLFVCSLAFPNLPTFLHVFEPRYRLLIRRALSTNKRLGIVLPSTSSPHGIYPYGTLLEIIKIDFLSDGRSLLEAIGVIRFQIIDIDLLDGYYIGTVKWIEDVDHETELRLQDEADPTESIEALTSICTSFVDVLRSGSTPWVLQRLNNTFGPPPSDPAQFSYWMAMVLPMADEQKAQLLPITTVRLRLKLIVHWIHGLKSQWWFRGCLVS